MTSWAKVRLGDVCEFKYGKSLAASERSGAGVEVFGSNGVVGHHHQALTGGPTIVVGRKGSLGEVNYSAGPCWPIDTTYFIDSTCTDADLRWLAHRLSGLALTTLNRAAAVPGLNREDAYRLPLLLPPLQDQRRIARTLDSADALRAKRRATLALLDSLASAVFLEMFGEPASNPRGWPVVTIGALLESASYGTSQKADLTGDVPVLRMGNVTSKGEIDLTDMKFMGSAVINDERYLLRSGDLLFNRTNSIDLVGKTAVFRGTTPTAYAGYLIRLRTNDQSDPDYLSAFLNSLYAKRVLKGMCKSIIGMANINATELKAIRIPRPPLDLQREFASRLRAVDHLKSSLRSSSARLDQLFASLQHQAFNGEL